MHLTLLTELPALEAKMMLMPGVHSDTRTKPLPLTNNGHGRYMPATVTRHARMLHTACARWPLGNGRCAVTQHNRYIYLFVAVLPLNRSVQQFQKRNDHLDPDPEVV
jgi:hypothetical protein